MKALLAIVAGFGASLGMFAGGLAFAVYLLAVEPERQQSFHLCSFPIP